MAGKRPQTGSEGRSRFAANLMGWCEWVSLPNLGIDPIRAKMDTGARTSVLHALELRTVATVEGLFVHFKVHPRQGCRLPEVWCRARVIDSRFFKDSGGHRERRHVVETTLTMAHVSWPIHLSLTDRSDMGFRLLLGRSALRGWMISPGKSHILTRRHLEPGILISES